MRTDGPAAATQEDSMIQIAHDLTVSISDLRALSAEAASAGNLDTAAAALLVAGLDLDTPALREAAEGWDGAMPWRIVFEAYQGYSVFDGEIAVRNLSEALRLIRDARDALSAGDGVPFGPDQAFDDWAADVADRALAAVFGDPR